MTVRTLVRLRGALTALIACASALAVAGCVGAPVQEMSDARQAIHAAAAAGADERAPDKLADAKRLLESAEEKLYRRAYTGARHDALRARTIAIEALRASDSDIPPQP